MTSKYSGYSSDHGRTPPSYRRDFSSPLSSRKSSDLPSSHRPSPLFDSRQTAFPSSSSSSRLSSGYSTLPGRSTLGSTASYSPSVSHRKFCPSSTFSSSSSSSSAATAMPAFNRSISNDFGVSYASRPKPTSGSLGLSSVDLSRSSTTNLTPFVSRYSAESSRSPSSSNYRPTYSSSYVDAEEKGSKTSTSGKEENFRILISRATSSHDSASKTSSGGGGGTIADTRTEKLPLNDTTRRRQLKNAYAQTEEILQSQLSPPLPPSSSSSSFPSSYPSKPASAADQILPKQSGFVPKNRNFRFQSKSDAEDEPPILSIKSRVGQESIKENITDDFIPRQSSFLKKIRQDKDGADRVPKEAPRPAAGTPVTLKESIEKVKTWKKLMQENLDYKDDDDDADWRKKMRFKSNANRSDATESEDETATTPTSAPAAGRDLKSNLQIKQEGVSGFLGRASSCASLLADPVGESSESSRVENRDSNKTFIGRLKDIDSLLDFEDSAGEICDFNDTQVSSWTEGDFARSEDIDDLLDGDLGQSRDASHSTGTAKKTRLNLIANNPFMRQTSRLPPAAGDKNEAPIGDDVGDATDPSRCRELVGKLLEDVLDSEDLLIERLIDGCQLGDQSSRYRRLQDRLKSEQKFTGFETVRETLEYLKVDVAQLEECAVLLYREWKRSRAAKAEVEEEEEEEAAKGQGAKRRKQQLNCLRPQSSLDDDDDNSEPDEDAIKMAVTIHALIDFLNKGKELRRVLFSLKKIFKNQPGCIKEFIYSDGLTSLIKVAEANASNSTYQCYILRVIGQLMLNVDGMNGIVSINKVVQWLYDLTASSSPLVSRTALRLLTVFISYSECNSFLFIQAVSSASLSKGKKTFSNLMDILKKGGNSSPTKDDPSLLVLGLINKTLQSVPDQDSFYDVADSLAEQGLEKVFWTKTSFGSATAEFVEQMKAFDNMVKQEDIRQLEQQQKLSPSSPTGVVAGDDSKERERIQSRTANRRSVYYSKRDDILKKEINRRNAIKQANQQKLIKDFEGNKISNAETDRSLNDFKRDLAEGTFSGLIGKARDGLAMSQAPSSKLSRDQPEVVAPVVKSEAQLKWEEAENRALERLKRNDLRLSVKDMDFTDVTEVDEINYIDVRVIPPPLSSAGAEDAKRRPGFQSTIPNPPSCPPPIPPGLPPIHPPAPPPPLAGNAAAKKEASKTLRLHWREARSEFPLPSGRMGDTIWSRVAKEIGQVKIDREEFERLFHSKSVDIKIKSEGHKKEQSLLDAKRSNMINIALIALPQPSLMKIAIVNMDTSILSKEAVEKLLTLLPSEEEKTKLIEAQLSRPEVPLGQAEQFLLTLSSIAEVKPRLKLWLFMLDFDSSEGEIGDALADLKQAMEQAKSCCTLKYALSVLLAVGNCLNSTQAKGFTLDFLSKVPDVKDSVKKKTLLHHLVSFVIQFYSDATDIFSEIGAVHRCSKVDWDEMEEKLKKLEEGCKSSWDDIRTIVKHDSNQNLKNKLSSVLADFAERTLVLKIVHRRMTNKFKRFLLYFGYQSSDIIAGSDVKIHQVFKVMSAFALEWRTTRSKILHNKKKKETERERKMAASLSNLSLCRSTHGSISADESTIKNVISKPPMFPNNNNNNNGGYAKLLSAAPKVSKWPSTSNVGYCSETESAYETGDEEFFGAVLRSAAASPSPQKRQTRESRRRLSIDKSSPWRSSSRDRNGY